MPKIIPIAILLLAVTCRFAAAQDAGSVEEFQEQLEVARADEAKGQQAVDTEMTTRDEAVAASEEAKQVNPQARPARHGRKFWISVTPLIVAVAFLVVVSFVVPK